METKSKEQPESQVATVADRLKEIREKISEHRQKLDELRKEKQSLKATLKDVNQK